MMLRLCLHACNIYVYIFKNLHIHEEYEYIKNREREHLPLMSQIKMNCMTVRIRL